jgi:hypothetical protein
MSSKAVKRLRREQEHDRWLRSHGRRCVACGRDLDDEGLVDGVDPREPRTCVDCCGAEVPDHEADAAVAAGWAYREPKP